MSDREPPSMEWESEASEQRGQEVLPGPQQCVK